MNHRFISRLVITCLAFRLLAGCCGCDKKSDDYLCEGGLQGADTLHYSIGTNGDAKKARDSAIWGACFTYCTQEDPAVDSAYTEWKASPEGQKSRLGRGSDIDVHSALDSIRNDCREKCELKVGAGLMTVGTKCHPPQGGEDCTTSLTYGGSTWTATLDGEHSEYHSRRMACRTYCKEGDPTIQKMYDEWKVSERGKQANYSTQDRALESDDVLFEAVNACQSKCMGDLMTGKATADTKCQ